MQTIEKIIQIKIKLILQIQDIIKIIMIIMDIIIIIYTVVQKNIEKRKVEKNFLGKKNTKKILDIKI